MGHIEGMRETRRCINYKRYVASNKVGRRLITHDKLEMNCIQAAWSSTGGAEEIHEHLIQNIRCHNRDSNRVPYGYESASLTPEPFCSVGRN